MKRRIFAIFAAGMLLTACGGEGGSAELSVDDLTGTWVCELSDGTKTLTLSSDMTYKQVYDLGGAVPMTTETNDTWELSGSKISIHYSDFGTVSDYTMTLDGSTMTWDNGDAQIVYKRK